MGEIGGTGGRETEEGTMIEIEGEAGAETGGEVETETEEIEIGGTGIETGTGIGTGTENRTEIKRLKKRRDLGVEAKIDREVPNTRKVRKTGKRGVTRRIGTETGKIGTLPLKLKRSQRTRSNELEICCEMFL